MARFVLSALREAKGSPISSLAISNAVMAGRGLGGRPAHHDLDPQARRRLPLEAQDAGIVREVPVAGEYKSWVLAEASDWGIRGTKQLGQLSNFLEKTCQKATITLTIGARRIHKNPVQSPQHAKPAADAFAIYLNVSAAVSRWFYSTVLTKKAKICIPAPCLVRSYFYIQTAIQVGKSTRHELLSNRPACA
jgi:hypothetical protein